MWWYTLLIPALMKLRQEDGKFEASLSYTARTSQKNKKDTNIEIKPFLFLFTNRQI
jgi:hypothetical protein